MTFSRRHQSTSSQEERAIWMRILQSASTTSTSRFQLFISKIIFTWLDQIDTIVTSEQETRWSRSEEDTKDLMSMFQGSIANSRRSWWATWWHIIKVLSGCAMNLSKESRSRFLHLRRHQVQEDQELWEGLLILVQKDLWSIEAKNYLKRSPPIIL